MKESYEKRVIAMKETVTEIKTIARLFRDLVVAFCRVAWTVIRRKLASLKKYPGGYRSL